MASYKLQPGSPIVFEPAQMADNEDQNAQIQELKHPPTMKIIELMEKESACSFLFLSAYSRYSSIY